MKESIIIAFDFVRANRSRLGIERDIDNYDFHVQIVDLMRANEGSQAGAAFLSHYILCYVINRLWLD